MDELFDAARLRLGATREERLCKARARTVVLNKRLARQHAQQQADVNEPVGRDEFNRIINHLHQEIKKMQNQPTLKCSQRIWREGGTAPKTCAECGKGPCKEAEENKITASPEEYQLVPKEPTEKMVISAGIHHSITTNQAANIYKTMLAHVPHSDTSIVPTPAHWHALANHAAEALQVITGHDSLVNLEHRYGKNWWEPLDELRTQLLAMCSNPPTQPSTDTTVNDSISLHPGHPDYPVLSDEELSNKVTEIAHAIEACGASPELTHAVTLVSDFGYHLRRSINQKAASRDVPHTTVKKLVKVADLANVNARLAANQIMEAKPQTAQRVIGWCDLIDVELKQLEAMPESESNSVQVEELKARCRELELALETAQGDAEDQRRMKCRAREQRSTAQEYIRQLLAELKRIQWEQGAITPNMDAAGREAVARAEADGCSSFHVLCKVYAEAANQAAYSEIENINADVPPKPCLPNDATIRAAAWNALARLQGWSSPREQVFNSNGRWDCGWHEEFYDYFKAGAEWLSSLVDEGRA